MTGNRSILVVNDHDGSRYATVRILQRAGFDVREARSGTAALQLIDAAPPAVVVLDINLPDIGGIEICRRLKHEMADQMIMVLQVSATNITTADRVASLDAGADSFLVEPVEPEELVAVTRALLRLFAAEETARQHIAERDLLLKEVNHRVKNSLQLVSSILALQRRRLNDSSIQDAFDQAMSRVRAIAAIHERLYRNEHPMRVAMKSYLAELGAEMAQAGSESGEQATIEVRSDEVDLSADDAVPLGLIVNELVTNSLKHARSEAGPLRIEIDLGKRDDGSVILTVADNGTDRVAASGAAGLGSMLINALVRQIEGEFGTSAAEGGYRATLTFRARGERSWLSAP
jgi:two-component sensor histidine kinase